MEEPFIEVIQRSTRREREIVFIGLDAIKHKDDDENKFSSLNWVLANLVRSGDKVIVLAVIYNEQEENQLQADCLPSFWPFRRSRGMQQVAVSQRDVAMFEHLHGEICLKKEMYMKSLRPYYDRYEAKGVKMEIKIAAGYPPAYIIVREANNAGVSWVVLDRELRKYRKDIADSSGCNVAVIGRNNVPSIISSGNKLPSYSISAEGTITTVPAPILKRCSSIISAGQIQENRQMQTSRPSIGVPVDLYINGRADVTEDCKTFISAVQSPSKRKEKTCLTCSFCDNRQKAKAKLSPPRELSPDEITKVTNDDLLAQNGTWQLYKGILDKDSSSEYNVLVKKFEASSFETQFKAEIDIVKVARHRNILALLAFCDDKLSPALIYEYACNGWLDRLLSCPKILSWAARRRIAIGVAKGLRYLHEECGEGTIVHRDIRSSNIMLTHDFLPLICNFGSARRLATDEVCRESRVWGTAGYVAPEYSERGILSVKVDTYSFGVLLLELISGSKALDLSGSEDQSSLVEMARPLVEIHAFHELLDPDLVKSVDMYELYCMISASSLCIQKDPRSRPSMNQVVSILKGDRPMIKPPSPIFCNTQSKYLLDCK